MLCGEAQLSNVLQNPPERGLRIVAHSSIRVQEGEPLFSNGFAAYSTQRIRLSRCRCTACVRARIKGRGENLQLFGREGISVLAEGHRRCLPLFGSVPHRLPRAGTRHAPTG